MPPIHPLSSVRSVSQPHPTAVVSSFWQASRVVDDDDDVVVVVGRGRELRRGPLEERRHVVLREDVPRRAMSH